MWPDMSIVTTHIKRLIIAVMAPIIVKSIRKRQLCPMVFLQPSRAISEARLSFTIQWTKLPIIESKYLTAAPHWPAMRTISVKRQSHRLSRLTKIWIWMLKRTTTLNRKLIISIHVVAGSNTNLHMTNRTSTLWSLQLVVLHHRMARLASGELLRAWIRLNS